MLQATTAKMLNRRPSQAMRMGKAGRVGLGTRPSGSRYGYVSYRYSRVHFENAAEFAVKSNGAIGFWDE
jgi:hypothetical protein